MKHTIVFWVSVFFASLVIVILTGCAEKVYVDRPVDVKVPIKCNAPEVERAKAGVNDAESLIEIIRERDELREAVKVCR